MRGELEDEKLVGVETRKGLHGSSLYLSTVILLFPFWNCVRIESSNTTCFNQQNISTLVIPRTIQPF